LPAQSAPADRDALVAPRGALPARLTECIEDDPAGERRLEQRVHGLRQRVACQSQFGPHAATRKRQRNEPLRMLGSV
jgi:hypothetical protein